MQVPCKRNSMTLRPVMYEGRLVGMEDFGGYDWFSTANFNPKQIHKIECIMNALKL